MQKTLLSVLSAISFLLVVALPAHAQSRYSSDESRVTLNAGVGFTFPIQDTKGRIDSGLHVTVGGGYYFDKTFGITGEYSWHDFDVSGATLTDVNVPSADSNLISITGNFSGRFGTKSPVGGYFIGGGGVYRRSIEFNEPVSGPPTSTTIIDDPWFGDTVPSAVAGGTVLGKFTTWNAGVNFGGGITFSLGGETRLFIEARYHHVFTSPTRTQYVPVTVGVRW